VVEGDALLPLRGRGTTLSVVEGIHGPA